MLKLILINIRNTLILLALLYFSIPIVTEASSLLQTWFPKPDNRAKVVNYRDAPWAEQHFKEFNELKTEYAGFVGWRHRPYLGVTIHIDGAQRIRLTPAIPGLHPTPATYFFGGSVMWGTGVRDDMTIPAYFQELSKETAVNYGEIAWTAHQSLNRLMEVMVAGPRPSNVVFYDGGNEIARKCRRDSNFFSHSNERQIRDALEYKSTEFGYYWRTVKDAAKAVRTVIFGPKRETKKIFDCDTNPQKAALIAEALISDWKIAKYIAEDKGAHFFAFLQPVSALSKTRLSQIDPAEIDPEINKQLETVYPLMRAKMKESGIGIDLSGIFDHDEYYYIDCCHVSPNGNHLVAEAMWKAMTASAQSSGD